MKNLYRGLMAVSVLTMALNVGVPAWAGVGHSDEEEKVAMFYGEPGKAEDVSMTISVDAMDMDFSSKTLKINHGETVRFIVTNTDEIEHDFTIAPAMMQEMHRGKMMEMMDSGVDMSKMHKEPNAVFVKPGETKELIWKFADVQELEFACNVPGHYESGMKGNFIMGHGDTHGH